MSSFTSVLYSILGERIKNRREEMGFSQQQLAEFISSTYELKRSSISNIERGRQQPPLHIIYEICKVLKFDVQMILPTYSEVQKKVDFENDSNIESFISKLDIDQKTLREIRKYLK